MAPKRKHDEINGAFTRTQKPPKRQNLSRIDATLKQAQKKVHRALKLAKGFERQKLSRRQRNAQVEGNAAETARIKAEIEAWRVRQQHLNPRPGLITHQTLDVGQTAIGYLSRLVTRHKTLSQVSELVQSATTPHRPVSDVATANVTARLYNSNPVKAAAQQVGSDLLACTGSGRQSRPSQSQPRSLPDRPKQAMSRERSQGHSTFSAEGISDAQSTRRVERRQDRSTLQSISTDVQDESIPDSDISAMEEQYASRIASEPDEDSADEGEDPGPRINLDRSNDEWSGSDSGLLEDPEGLSDSSSSSVATEVQSEVPVEASRSSVATKRPPRADEKFLPALSTGGYLSGSDSDASEIESLSDAPQKRNRRGQRARQQIWEQKYKTKAKHLQKPHGAARGRDEGWDMQRGARGPKKTRNGRSAVRSGATGANADAVQKRAAEKRQPNSIRPVKPKRDDTGSLHPSWQARKKAKDAPVTAPFQGQKITFD